MLRLIFGDAETRQTYRFLWVGFILAALFIISLVRSCSELKLTLWGETATAALMQVEPPRKGERTIVIRYRFTDARGEAHTVRRRIEPTESMLVAGQEIDVIYLPKRPEAAKLVIERSMVWPIILGVFILISGLWLLNAWRLASQGRLA